jgi:hypothetical protein
MGMTNPQKWKKETPSGFHFPGAEWSQSVEE